MGNFLDDDKPYIIRDGNYVLLEDGRSAMIYSNTREDILKLMDLVKQTKNNPIEEED